MTWHRVYGLSLDSELPFVTPLPEDPIPEAPLPKSNGIPRLRIQYHPPSPSRFAEERGAALYRSPLQTHDLKSVSTLYRLHDSPLLCFTGVGEFHLPPGRIEIYPLQGVPNTWIELRLLGAVLPFLLESRQVPTLHAATLEHRGLAISLVSVNGGGKTTLAAAGLAAGASLLADDLLALDSEDDRFMAAPGFPQMRMWPESTHHFLPGAELEPFLPGMDKKRVPIGPGGLGQFCPRPTPLAGIYLVERQPSGSAIQIEPLGPAGSLMQLVRHSFTPYVVEALGWQARRLETFGRLLESVPVKSLRYPSGLDRLPEVVDRLFSDLET